MGTRIDCYWVVVVTCYLFDPHIIIYINFCIAKKRDFHLSVHKWRYIKWLEAWIDYKWIVVLVFNRILWCFIGVRGVLDQSKSNRYAFSRFRVWFWLNTIMTTYNDIAIPNYHKITINHRFRRDRSGEVLALQLRHRITA